VTDVFGDNRYDYDARNTFINWTINTMGAYDYAADSWGYTYGATAEWKQDWWTARAGVFQLSLTPNSEEIEPVLFRQFEPVLEFEERHTLMEQPGKLKFLLRKRWFHGEFQSGLARRLRHRNYARYLRRSRASRKSGRRRQP
jgi:high affinity Mn2+ porin